ncbi:MAG: restriction endonuclease subunit S [Gemmatimonadota bacterium]
MNVPYIPKHTTDSNWHVEIPLHWKLTSLKRVLAEPLKYGATEAGDCDDTTLPRYIRITDFDSDGNLRTDTFASLPEEIAHSYYLREGDVLFARSGATVGKTFLFRNYEGRACFAGYLIRASPARHKLKPEFLYYFTKSSAYEAWKNLIFTQATIQNIGADKYAYLAVCLPPVEEQTLIVNYLDAGCAAIGTAVAAKHEQLDLLRSIWQATLHSQFAPMMQGVLERIKDVTSKIGSGVTPEGGASVYLSEGVPLLRSQNVHFDGLRLDDVAFISAETHAEMESSQLRAGDVLLNITGASIGRCTSVPEAFGEGNVNQHVCIVRPSERVRTEFLVAFLSSPQGQSQVFSSFTGASRQGLSHKELGLIRIPLPGLDVQDAVCAGLRTKHAELKRAATIIEAQLSTLIAYRKSLIHECVTGQRRITDDDVKRVSAALWERPEGLVA